MKAMMPTVMITHQFRVRIASYLAMDKVKKKADSRIIILSTRMRIHSKSNKSMSS